MAHVNSQPCIGIIGGTGLGDALGAYDGEARRVDTPFGAPSSDIVLSKWQGVDIAVLQRHGPGHVFNPSAVPYRANMFALKAIGVTHVIASGATGSLREDIHPGDVVIADQIIDKTYKRTSTFYERAAVHVEMAEPFCPVMRRWLINAAASVTDTKCHESGTYVCMEGPAFSTQAESHLHRAINADLIGMTVMPEAKLAKEAELPYALIALPTDYDCWKSRKPGEHDEAPHDLLAQIMSNLQKSTAAGIALIQAALDDNSYLRDHPCPAHDALKLAIWSDRSAIEPDEVRRLQTLWGRYF